jgi:hypothetical protein
MTMTTCSVRSSPPSASADGGVALDLRGYNNNMTATKTLVHIDIPNAEGVVDALARIVHEGDIYIVTWTDFVANDWSERYVTLGAALARIALLADCGLTDWRSGFRGDDARWEHDWAGFSSDHRS